MQQETAQRSLLRNAFYIFLLKLFPALAILAVTILYSRELPKDDYGIYQNVWIKLLFLGTLAYVGLPVVIITWSAPVIKYLALRLKRTHVLLYICWFVILSLIFYVLQSKAYTLSWIIIAGLLVLYAIHSIQEALLIAAQRMKELLVLNVLFAAYFVVVHIILLKDYSLKTLLVYLLIGMVVRAILLSAVCYSAYKPLQAEASSSPAMAEARNLWLHLGFYDVMQNVFRWIDKFILGVFLTAPVYAIYFNGSQDIPLLPYLLGAVSSSILVQLANKKQDSVSEKHVLMRESSKLLASIVFPLFFFLLVFSRELFSVVLTDKYLPAVPIFIVSLMVLPLRAYNYTNILQHLHKGALINKGALLDLAIALALMYPLYALFGLPGVPLAFVVSTYVQVAYYLYHTTRLLHVSTLDLLPVKDWVVKFIAFGVFFYLLHYMLAINHNSKSTLVIGAVAGVAVTVCYCGMELKRRKLQFS